MIVTWMLYASAIALCFTLAAIAAEWVLRAFRFPARGVWVLALLGSLVLPVLALVPNDRPIAVAQPSPSAWAELLPIPGPIAATRWTASWGPQANASVLVLWGVATVLLIGVLVGGTVRLARERRRWRTAKIGGEAVMISPATGPGVVGVLQSNIVVPEWVCVLEQELQNLIVSHEQEHRRAHDLLLVFLGLAAVVVCPWNAALWWQLRRIKLAIEIDCDRRVLGRGTSLRAYAELLVASAEYQVTRLQPGAMALADSRSQLERRIEDMTRSNVRSRGPRTVVHAVAAIALVAVACDTPLPEAPELSKQELDQKTVAQFGGGHSWKTKRIGCVSHIHNTGLVCLYEL